MWSSVVFLAILAFAWITNLISLLMNICLLLAYYYGDQQDLVATFLGHYTIVILWGFTSYHLGAQVGFHQYHDILEVVQGIAFYVIDYFTRNPSLHGHLILATISFFQALYYLVILVIFEIFKNIVNLCGYIFMAICIVMRRFREWLLGERSFARDICLMITVLLKASFNLPWFIGTVLKGIWNNNEVRRQLKVCFIFLMKIVLQKILSMMIMPAVFIMMIFRIIVLRIRRACRARCIQDLMRGLRRCLPRNTWFLTFLKAIVTMLMKFFFGLFHLAWLIFNLINGTQDIREVGIQFKEVFLSMMQVIVRVLLPVVIIPALILEENWRIFVKTIRQAYWKAILSMRSFRAGIIKRNERTGRPMRAVRRQAKRRLVRR